MIPVITIDGPSASGKGSVAERVARHLGFHYLDSGALYRLTALAARLAGVSLDQATALQAVVQSLDVHFEAGKIWLAGHEVSTQMRSETCAREASMVAALPEVRQELMARQRAFRQAPGLVADGRDMGSVVFADACLKVFLTAKPEIRAQRRYNQLIEKGMSASIDNLLQDIRDRDARDAMRSASPMVQGEARLLDTSDKTIEQAVQQILTWYRDCPETTGT